MHTTDYRFSYEVYDSINELDIKDAQLLEEAKKATGSAYAPYSKFRVGAAARLNNGALITGTNQENAAYPAGICAERVLMSVAATLHPGIPIESLAISYQSETIKRDHPITPCGICRQSLQEFEQRTKQPIRLILGGMGGKVVVIAQSNSLLPLSFTADDLNC